MMRFHIDKQFRSSPLMTERVSTVMRMFGLSVDRFDEHSRSHKCYVRVNDGDVVYITGPSGAGKSVLLREMQKQIAPDKRISIDDIELPNDRAVIDCVPAQTTLEALCLLGYAGLSDVFCVLTPPANLSEGQKYRFRLACAFAQCSGVPEAGTAGKPYIFADEFCSNLDRITAAVIAYNVRKFSKREGTTFFLASSHEDILADLQPDVLIVKHFTGPAEVTYKAVARRSIKRVTRPESRGTIYGYLHRNTKS